MSLVTFTGQGPTCNVDAPSVPPRLRFHSPQTADNFSNHLFKDISSPCSFSIQARLCTATVQHFAEAGSLPEQPGDLLGRSSVFLKSSQTLTSQNSCILLLLEMVITPKIMEDLSDCLILTGLKSFLQYCSLYSMVQVCHNLACQLAALSSL